MRSYYFRAARAILKKKVSDIAKESSISKNTVSKIENMEKTEEFLNNSSAKILMSYYKNNGIDISNKGVIILEFESNY